MKYSATVIRTTLLLLLSSLVLAACAAHRPVMPRPDDPHYAPVIREVSDLTPAPNGSIYQAASAVDLYRSRAHRVGDVLTINLNEATSASKSSGTSVNRENQIGINEATVLGENLLGGRVDLGTAVDTSVDFEGGGNSDQRNQLVGNITVTVSDVLPNGLLEVRGEKWLQLNHGSEFIRISGLVRKEDISPANTIASTRVADVRIAYSGTGTLADSNEPGWLTRFFVSKWLPF